MKVQINPKVDVKIAKVLRLIYVQEGKGAISKVVEQALEDFINKDEKLKNLYLKLIEK